MKSERDDPIERAIDPNRLLPGEDPKSRDLSDAHHWVRVYEELYRFKAGLITQTRGKLATLPPEAQRELKDTDLAIMLRESDRLASRLEFWQQRVHALTPALTDG